MKNHVPIAALLPVALLALAFVIYCLQDLFRRPDIKYLPRWVWALICLISIPLGGIIYLVIGRGEQ